MRRKKGLVLPASFLTRLTKPGEHSQEKTSQAASTLVPPARYVLARSFSSSSNTRHVCVCRGQAGGSRTAGPSIPVNVDVAKALHARY